MRRFSTVVTAAVASAMIVIAVTTLDAVGADKPRADAAITVNAFAACLRDRGVDVPNLSGSALDRWLKRTELPMDAARACKTALAGSVDGRATEVEVTKIVQCLRTHGFSPPTDPIELKRWIGEQRDPDVMRALKECGVGPAPAPGCAPKEEDHGPETAKAEPAS